MLTAFPNQIELSQRMYMQLASRARMLKFSTLVLPLGVVALFAVLVRSGIITNPDDLRAVLEAMAKGFARKPVETSLNILVFLLVIGQLRYMHWAQQRERLILNYSGIEYCSPLPAILRLLHPGWTLAWSQIRSVSLETLRVGRGPQLVVLKLDGGTRRVKLYPWRWVDPDNFEPITPWRDLRRQQKMTSLDIMQEIDKSPLLRYIAAALPHLEIHSSGVPMDVAFALEKNPVSLTVAVLFFTLVFYAFFDGVIFGPETYAGDIPMQWFIITGVLCASIAVLWMARSGVPKLESGVVALLFGAAVGAAAYPGTLRLNAFTDTDGLRTYEYVLQSDFVTLTAEETCPPDLMFPEYADYWGQFEPGSKHQFELRRGGLGFYQLNFEPVRTALRNFYRTRRQAE